MHRQIIISTLLVMTGILIAYLGLRAFPFSTPPQPAIRVTEPMSLSIHCNLELNCLECHPHHNRTY